MCKDKPGKVANPARGQLNRETNISLTPFATENLVSRDGFGSPVPRQPVHSQNIVKLNLVLTHGIPPDFRGGVHLIICTAIRHRVSPEFIESRNCVPMVFTAESPLAQGPVNLKVVPNGCCLVRSPWTN